MFGVWVVAAHGGQLGLEYYTGYLVEKSLSVDNLFVFMLLLAAFAVPRELQQRVLLIGVAGALVLRGIFIALGAADAAALRLDVPAVRRDPRGDVRQGAARRDPWRRRRGRSRPDAERAADSQVLARHRLVSRAPGCRSARTADARSRPLLLVVVAVMTTDIVFAVDSVPAVYGITGDPYLVFVTNAFALMGLRALYFVLEGALSRLVHLGYGLAAILAFIGAKLALHWAHGIWPATPEVPTLASLAVIVVVLGVVTATSLWATRRGSGDQQGVHIGG